MPGLIKNNSPLKAPTSIWDRKVSVDGQWRWQSECSDKGAAPNVGYKIAWHGFTGSRMAKSNLPRVASTCILANGHVLVAASSNPWPCSSSWLVVFLVSIRSSNISQPSPFLVLPTKPRHVYGQATYLSHFSQSKIWLYFLEHNPKFIWRKIAQLKKTFNHILKGRATPSCMTRRN